MIAFDWSFRETLQELGDLLRRVWFEPILQRLLGFETYRLLELSSAEEVALSDRMGAECPFLSPLLHLLCLEEPVSPAELECSIPAKLLAGLVRLGLLLDEGQHLRSDLYRLVPWQGMFFLAHSRMVRADAEGRARHRVPTVYLGEDSVLLCGQLASFAREGGTALDLGTGSGILAFSLARLQGMQVLALELDPEAFSVAQANLCMNRLEARVRIVQEDWLQMRLEAPVDRVVSNPPYVPCPPGLGYPRWGWGGADGLDAVRTILERAPGWLRADGVLELGLRAYGSEDSTPLEDVLSSKVGPAGRDWESALLIAELRRLDDASFRSLAAAALREEGLACEAELPGIAERLARHWSSLQLTHEAWASLRWRVREAGFRRASLVERVRSQTMLQLRPTIRLERGAHGLAELVEAPGQLLTTIPRRELPLFQAVRQATSVRDLSRSTGESLERCLEWARMYRRAGLFLDHENLW